MLSKWRACLSFEFGVKHHQFKYHQTRTINLSDLHTWHPIYIAALIDTLPHKVIYDLPNCRGSECSPRCLHSKWMISAVQSWLNHGSPATGKLDLKALQVDVYVSTNLLHRLPISPEALCSIVTPKQCAYHISDCITHGHDESFDIIAQCGHFPHIDLHYIQGNVKSSAFKGRYYIFKQLLNLTSTHFPEMHHHITFTPDIRILDIAITHPKVRILPATFLENCCSMRNMSIAAAYVEKVGHPLIKVVQEIYTHGNGDVLIQEPEIPGPWRRAYVQLIINSHSSLLPPSKLQLVYNLIAIGFPDLSPDQQSRLDLALLVSNPSMNPGFDYNVALQKVFELEELDAVDSLLLRPNVDVMVVADKQRLLAAGATSLAFLVDFIGHHMFSNRSLFQAFAAKVDEASPALFQYPTSDNCGITERILWLRDRVFSEFPVASTTRLIILACLRNGLPDTHMSTALTLLQTLPISDQQSLMDLWQTQPPDTTRLPDFITYLISTSPSIFSAFVTHKNSKYWIKEDHIQLASTTVHPRIVLMALRCKKWKEWVWRSAGEAVLSRNGDEEEFKVFERMERVGYKAHAVSRILEEFDAFLMDVA
ncbi:hypothetical protein BC829DRAFT_441332 [Chytridium lagenaria]|nr:hypothetical protein BC829DRAFT_441332 [Chytridium lagenaria]